MDSCALDYFQKMKKKRKAAWIFIHASLVLLSLTAPVMAALGTGDRSLCLGNNRALKGNTSLRIYENVFCCVS